MRKILLLPFLIYSTLSWAQAWETAKIFGGRDGQVYTYGTVLEENKTIFTLTSSSGDITDGSRKHQRLKGEYLLLTKFNPNGSVAWEKRFSGTLRATGTVLKATQDGFLYGAGYYEDSLTIGTNKFKSNGASDIFMFKATKTGDIVWARTFGGSAEQGIGDLEIDKNQNLIITGMFNGNWKAGTTILNNVGTYNVFVVKLNPDAIECLWAFSTTSTTSSESVYIYNAVKQQIVLDANQHVYLTAVNTTNNFFSIEETQIKTNSVLLKLNGKTGKRVWQESIATNATSPLLPTFNSVGHLYVGSSFGDTLTIKAKHLVPSFPNANLFISKWDTAGKWYWTKTGGGRGEEGGSFTQIVAVGLKLYAVGASDENSSFNGRTLAGQVPIENTAVFLAEFDSAGSVQKNLFYDKSWVASPSGLSINSTGNVLVSGYTSEGFKVSNTYVPDKGGRSSSSITSYLILTDASLTPIWTNALGSGGASGGNDVAIGVKESYFVGGYFGGLTIIGTDTLHTMGGDDGYLAKFDVKSKLNWTKQFKGMKDEEVLEIARDGKDNVYILGSFNSPKVTLDLLELVNKNNDYALFIAKVDSNGVAQWLKPISASYMPRYYGIQHALKVTTDGSTFFVAHSLNDRMNLLRFDGEGTLQGATTGTASGKSISDIFLYNNKVYFAGTFSGSLTFDTKSVTSSDKDDQFVGEMGLTGAVNWIRSYGGLGSQFVNSITVNDNGIYVAGAFYKTATMGSQTFNSENSSHLLTRLDFNGGLTKAISPTVGGFYPEANAIKISTDGQNLYVVGSYYGSINFGSKTIKTGISTDSYLAAFGCNLNFLNVYTIESDGIESPYSVASSPSYTVMTGYVNTNVVFNSTKIPSDMYGFNTAVGRINNEIVSTICVPLAFNYEKEARHIVQGWPNPSYDDFHLKWDKEESYQVKVTNVRGEEVQYLEGLGTEIILGDELVSGLYLISLKLNGQLHSVKWSKL